MEKSQVVQISSRVEHLLQPFSPHLEASFAAWKDPFDPLHNVQGYINFAVAENKLSVDLLLEKLKHCRNISGSVLGYDDMRGSEPFRKQIANLLSTYFFHRLVDIDGIFCCAGAGCALDLLFYCLLEEGDGVLLPAPYYPGFIHDIEGRARCKPVIVEPTGSHFRFQLADLEKKLLECRQSGQPVKALLLCSPNNPLGFTLSREELENIVSWTRQNSLQLIVDEIYGLSVFSKSSKMVSIGSVLEHLGNDVHFVWSFSKDFCMSGLRAGVIYTENHEIRKALRFLPYFCGVSGDTQFALTKLLSDSEFVQSFIRENTIRLYETYRVHCDCLDKMGIPYVPSEAGFFIWMDLNKYMASRTFENERTLWKSLFEKAKVVVTPGEVCHSTQPGWFRCCFSAASPEAAKVAWNRVEQMMSSQEKK
ncbi:hypothetical protein GpartN1_g1745.t1 [Galdieria partita]|uniref:Aminotransferase class I/classII large domain-containing protein n=1 Tax=Galdieria partita TaxID=83374 RepID=A0A9C7UNI6_9RHOD|nr:hypothetical protein GpartN1_g1745.t1 [Galdieria partita]